jgi:hypothetical protein
MTQIRPSTLALGRVTKISMPEGDREGTLDGVVESLDGTMVKINFQLWVEDWHDDELTYDAKRDVWHAVGTGHVTEVVAIAGSPDKQKTSPRPGA